MVDATLVEEKTQQATSVLHSLDIDCWMTFCRETTEIPDPSLPLLLGFDVVWPSMVLLTADGERHVILGRHDAPNARDLGVYEVHPYEESIAEPFHRLRQQLDPGEIAINYDEDDVTADGLTHGMYRRLRSLLVGTDHEDVLISASEVIRRVRGQKSPEEIRRIRTAAETTTDLLAAMAAAWRPSWTETDVAGWLHQRVSDRGLDTAWAWDYCPTVHAGKDSEVGHTRPGDRALPPGEVLHVDFGVIRDGYAADLQRVFYLPEQGETAPPAPLQRAFEDVRDGLHAGKEVLEPGVPGHEVDAAARSLITDRGHDAYAHALGHQVGRSAHDGGTLLGPEWDRYGDTVRQTVSSGEVYTLELGVETEYGYLGQEEMVHVTESGVEWIVEPQTGVYFLRE
jgi:Xaa-Pro aminopeptidase